MKRVLLILALCGSVVAQEPDPYQPLLDERATLEARLHETNDQIKFHRRKALYCRGLVIEGYNRIDEELYHERKAVFFRDLYYELVAELYALQQNLPVELERRY